MGVFVALAADNWMSQQGERVRSIELTRLLVEELDRDETLLQDLIAQMPEKVSATGAFLSTPASASVSDSVAMSWLRMLWVSPEYAPRDAVFQSVLETDALRFIGGPELQIDLLRYHGESQQRVTYWFDLQYARLSRLTDLFSAHLDLSPDGPDQATEFFLLYADVAGGWSSLRSDRELSAEIAILRSFEDQMTSIVEQTIAENRALQQRLQTVLAGR
jgi:hypothetical protein